MSPRRRIAIPIDFTRLVPRPILTVEAFRKLVARESLALQREIVAEKIGEIGERIAIDLRADLLRLAQECAAGFMSVPAPADGSGVNVPVGDGGTEVRWDGLAPSTIRRKARRQGGASRMTFFVWTGELQSIFSQVFGEALANVFEPEIELISIKTDLKLDGRLLARIIVRLFRDDDTAFLRQSLGSGQSPTVSRQQEAAFLRRIRREEVRLKLLNSHHGNSGPQRPFAAHFAGFVGSRKIVPAIRESVKRSVKRYWG